MTRSLIPSSIGRIIAAVQPAPPMIARQTAETASVLQVRTAGAVMSRVLIGYASRFGSTRDIAVRIADAIRERVPEVDVRAVDEIGDVTPYDAVVFGSGVYDGSWTPDATAFVRRHAEALARKAVWLFSVGSFGDRHPIVGGMIRKEPKEIGEFEEAIHPRDYRVFAGVIDLDHWPAWGRLLYKAFGGEDGDNRHWPDIDAWAKTIAADIPRDR